MNAFEKLGVPGMNSIDWEITPELTFTMFESWGSKLWIRSLDERYYYFFIDDWQHPARLCLMERGLKYAKVVAAIAAPQEMIDNCVKSQGKKIGLDQSFAINEEIKQWLIKNVLDANDGSKVTKLNYGEDSETMHTDLPSRTEAPDDIHKTILRAHPKQFIEKDISDLVRRHNFFDAKINPQGRFDSYLVDNGDDKTVTDMATGLIWQRHGFDISSIRRLNKKVEELNRQSFAGYSDWRIPTAEEALSLMRSQVNEKDLHIHECFSKEQPFIFLADQRMPGGYWCADFKQGRIFWASGTNPGAFGRLCRSISD